jgi:hypothetical protein
MRHRIILFLNLIIFFNFLENKNIYEFNKSYLNKN